MKRVVAKDGRVLKFRNEEAANRFEASQNKQAKKDGTGKSVKREANSSK